MTAATAIHVNRNALLIVLICLLSPFSLSHPLFAAKKKSKTTSASPSPSPTVNVTVQQPAVAKVNGIHTAPIVITGAKIKSGTGFPIPMYRLFRSDAQGVATAVPFQIDEVNEWGDYVLDQGGDVTANTGNGRFDAQDELVLMGDDVGPVNKPTKFPGNINPLVLIEVRIFYNGTNPVGPQAGAVYLGIFLGTPPELSQKRYVNFNRASAEVVTSRYRYGFDQQNWLVSRRVEMRPVGAGSADDFLPLLDSTTFYLKADLKYFLTLEVNHGAINSALEAYKMGPVRSIVRVMFFYSILKLNFELGMYTEISFFSNAVFLPAIMYNPLDGQKSLNRGSGFYYGISLRDSPLQYNIQSNMIPIKSASTSSFTDFFTANPSLPTESLYWVTASGNDRMLYMEISPSPDMRKLGALPQLYREDKSGEEIKNRGNDKAKPLGDSPVNMAIYFDMTKFTEGEHVMSFKLFFENVLDEKRLANFKNLSNWNVVGVRQ